MKDDFFFFSFGDLSTKAIWEDVKYLIFGYFLVYFYVQVMLGRFNKVEQRVRNDDLQLFLFSSLQKFTFFIFVLSINQLALQFSSKNSKVLKIVNYLKFQLLQVSGGELLKLRQLDKNQNVSFFICHTCKGAESFKPNLT